MVVVVVVASVVKVIAKDQSKGVELVLAEKAIGINQPKVVEIVYYGAKRSNL